MQYISAVVNCSSC